MIDAIIEIFLLLHLPSTLPGRCDSLRCQRQIRLIASPVIRGQRRHVSGCPGLITAGIVLAVDPRGGKVATDTRTQFVDFTADAKADDAAEGHTATVAFVGSADHRPTMLVDVNREFNRHGAAGVIGLAPVKRRSKVRTTGTTT